MAVDLAWPTLLPLPSMAGYELQPKPNVIETEVEIGPARARRRSTQTPTEIPVQLELTAHQQAIFDAWYRYRAGEGTVWFSIDYLSGIGLVPCEARFKGKVTHRPRNGERWLVSATLLVRDRPMLSEADLDAALAAGTDYTALFAAIDGIHHIITDELWTPL